jgi:hypothetical protein
MGTRWEAENMEQEDNGLLLLSTVAGLAEEYGNLAVLVAMHHLLAMEVEEDGCCLTCHRKAQWLDGQMQQQLVRYQQEFPAIDAIAKVNHPGPRGMIQ